MEKKSKIALSKCQQIAAKSRTNSDFSARLVEGNYNIIARPIKTRWNSEIDMINGVLAIKREHLNSYLQACNLNNLDISIEEWKNLVDIYNILEPFATITDLTQADKTVTISMVIPSIYELRSHLASIASSSVYSKDAKAFAKVLSDDLERRFEGRIH